MTESFTPGPWSFEATCFDRRIPIRGGVTAYGRPYTVAWVNRPGSARVGEDKANARLIAAAPALLDALQLIADTSHDPNAMNIATKAIALALSQEEVGEGNGASRSQPCGVGPLDQTDPQPQHSDGEG